MSSARLRRRLVTATVAAAVTAGSFAAAAGAAAALSTAAQPPSNLGAVGISPSSGQDETRFAVTVDATCPAGTVYSQFTIGGPDIPLPDSFVAAGGPDADSVNGLITRTNVSFANLKTIYPGSFFQAGTTSYAVTYDCWNLASERTTAQYVATIDYASAGPGASGTWTVTSPPGPDPVFVDENAAPLDGAAGTDAAQPDTAQPDAAQRDAAQPGAAPSAAAPSQQEATAGAPAADTQAGADAQQRPVALAAATPTDPATIVIGILVAGALLVAVGYVVRTIRANRTASRNSQSSTVGPGDRTRDLVP